MLGSKLRSLTLSHHRSPTKKVLFFSLLSRYNIIKVVCFALSSWYHPLSYPFWAVRNICHGYHLFIHPQTADGTSHMLATELCLALMVHKTAVVSVLKSRTRSSSTGNNQKVPQSLFIIRPSKENIWKIHILHLISSDFCSSLGRHTSSLQGWMNVYQMYKDLSSTMKRWLGLN